MIIKDKEKEQAIVLRKEGKTYSEILAKIPVAKSTLSIWLRDVGLAKTQKQRITELRKISQKKGAARKHEIRLEKLNEIRSKAKGAFQNISTRELHIIGLMLYWAEGSKEKDWKIGSGVIFSNSDPKMIQLFIKWLIECKSVPSSDISCSVYIHDSHRSRVREVIKYWQNVVGSEISPIKQIYFKRNKINTKRRNIRENYYGLLRVRVLKSSTLLREITSLIEVVCDNLSKVRS